MSADDTPPRFLADEGFNNHIVAGLRRAQPLCDIRTASEEQILGMPDPDVLRHAQSQNRILLTHDKKTMPAHFVQHLAALLEGEHSPGVMLLPQATPIGIAIASLLDIWELSFHADWQNQFTYLPLKR